MVLILEGLTYSKILKGELKKKTSRYFDDKKVYVAIIFLGDNSSSRAYVKIKKKFGEDIGMGVEVFGQDETTSYGHLIEHKKNILDSHSQQDIIDLIEFLNSDELCVGIIIQLPLPVDLISQTSYVASHISPSKDIDAMSATVYGMDTFDLIDFLGATPQAVMTLLKNYSLDNLTGKTISILGQSNLIGKPLASHLIKQGATVFSFNSESPQEQMKNFCRQSDYIFSCTGVVHLIDETFIGNKKNQIIVDIGYGHKNGIPVGDVNIEAIKDLVYAYTPVPGGVGPLTVASLFENIFRIVGV